MKPLVMAVLAATALGSLPAPAAEKPLELNLRSRVKTADEFIVHIASGTVSGSPYFVRYPDGKQVPSGDFLREELKRINQAAAAN